MTALASLSYTREVMRLGRSLLLAARDAALCRVLE